MLKFNIGDTELDLASCYGFDPVKDAIVDSVDESKRLEIAKTGYGIDKLVNDSSWRVRKVVASFGYGIQRLKDDVDWRVRKEICDHLDERSLRNKLNDSSKRVRDYANTLLSRIQ